MKYSYMSFSTPKANFEEMLSIAKKYGYEGIEPRVESRHAHGIELGISDEKASEIKKLCNDYGVELACIATSCRLAIQKNASAQVETAINYIRLAAKIGAKAIRVFGGILPKEVTREEAIETLVLSLKNIAAEAENHGVAVCLETHDSWSDPEHVKQVMEMVDESFIGVNWDIMHPVIACGWEIKDAYNALKSWIRHVHVHDGVKKDGVLTLMPIGTGDVDHKEAMELLAKDGYRGYVSGEWINWEPWEIHLPSEIKMLREYTKF